MRIIGLTGGTGSGKSEAARRFIEHGIPVIDADRLGHDLIAPGGAAVDAVIAGDFFDDWPGEDELTRELEERLAQEADYERRLDEARRWGKEWHFRIGVHLLRRLTDPSTAGGQYADLASAMRNSARKKLR